MCLQGLQHHLQQQPSLLEEYDAIIPDHVKQGVWSGHSPTHTDGHAVHYLPHHVVVRQDKETTKIRIVYDTSAKITGPSLNNCLYTGPIFLTRGLWTSYWDSGPWELPWFLTLSKHFCKTVLTSETKMSCSFSDSMMWLNLSLKSRPWSSHVSSLECRSASRHTLSWWRESQSQFTLMMLWVEPKPITMYQDSKAMPHAGGFNLCKLNTNSSELWELIHQEENTGQSCPTFTADSDEMYSKTMLGSARSIAPGKQKMLGVKWYVETDHFGLDISKFSHQARSLSPTKWHIVSLVGKIYDPLDFLSPVLIRVKSLFQELCELKLEWDEPLKGAPLRR